MHSETRAGALRTRWLVASLVLGLFAALSLVGIIWDAVVDRAYWSLFMLPVVAAFWYWLIVGALRRADG